MTPRIIDVLKYFAVDTTKGSGMKSMQLYNHIVTTRNKLLNVNNSFIIKNVSDHNPLIRSLIFKSISRSPRLIIVTPSSRPLHQLQAMRSIRFRLISQWIIIHDTRKRPNATAVFSSRKHSDKIIELFCNDSGGWGNAQRNFALDHIPVTYPGLLYFLDDDNYIHGNLWNIVQTMPSDGIATFDTVWPVGGPFPGDSCRRGAIDSSMFLVGRAVVGGIRWDTGDYSADGRFIEAVCRAHLPRRHRYHPVVAGYITGQQRQGLAYKS